MKPSGFRSLHAQSFIKIKLKVSLTFNDSEHDQHFDNLVWIFHGAREKSCFLFLHVVDLQAVISSIKLVVRALDPLGPFGWPASTHMLYTTLILSPNSPKDTKQVWPSPTCKRKSLRWRRDGCWSIGLDRQAEAADFFLPFVDFTPDNSRRCWQWWDAFTG